MKDIIFIQQLRIETIIGVFPWERQQKQPLLIDLELATNIHAAAASENLQDTIDYAQVAVRITDFVANSQFLLLETLAEAIAKLLLVEFKASWLKLQLAKPLAVLNAKQVGLIIERTVESYQNKEAQYSKASTS